MYTKYYFKTTKHKIIYDLTHLTFLIKVSKQLHIILSSKEKY